MTVPNYHGAKGYGYDGWTPPRTVPGKFGARASKLYSMLASGHNKLKLTEAELHRITLWLDCNSDFFGSFLDVEAQCRGETVTLPLE